MTEEEAKTKWCPHARVVLPAGGYASGNRFDDSQPNPDYMESRCIASDCMMWKWLRSSGKDGYGRPEEKTGYCGLIK